MTQEVPAKEKITSEKGSPQPQYGAVILIRERGHGASRHGSAVLTVHNKVPRPGEFILPARGRAGFRGSICRSSSLPACRFSRRGGDSLPRPQQQASRSRKMSIQQRNIQQARAAQYSFERTVPVWWLQRASGTCSDGRPQAASSASSLLVSARGEFAWPSPSLLPSCERHGCHSKGDVLMQPQA